MKLRSHTAIMPIKLICILFLLILAGSCAESGYNPSYMVSDSIPEETVVESNGQR